MRVSLCVAVLALSGTGLSVEVAAAKQTKDIRYLPPSDRTATEWLSVGKDEIDDEAGRECGVHCLAFVLRMFSVEHSVKEIRAATRIADRGISMGEIERVATKMGLPLKVVRCDPATLCRLPMPVICADALKAGRETEPLYGSVKGDSLFRDGR